MVNGYCLTSDEVEDLFVGVRFVDGNPQVVFPHGYDLSDDEKECRKDVFRLLGVLQKYAEKREGNRSDDLRGRIAHLPISSYQYIIQDFFSKGYYTEKEIRYSRSVRGKISWKRTVQKEKPQVDGDNAVYLQFQTKTNRVNSDKLITKIHQYCVYKSLFLFGWLFFSKGFLPPKPQIGNAKNEFIAVLQQELNSTFNDSKRRLFTSMINILLDDTEDEYRERGAFGVNRFDSVWEEMIDRIFGEPDKDRYFPHAKWHIVKDGNITTCRPLEPDTIMKYGGKIYVLDAKYYQFGITEIGSDLPGTSSIQKQITYGKHIAGMGEVPVNDVFNAFVMPYNSKGNEVYKFIGVGTADWEPMGQDAKNYAYVLGILADTKKTICQYIAHNTKEIEDMAELIESSLASYRRTADA